MLEFSHTKFTKKITQLNVQFLINVYEFNLHFKHKTKPTSQLTKM